MGKKLTTKEFIDKAREVHGDKYDYSKVEYINAVTKVCIICPNHGEFWQAPYMHLTGRGCPKCVKNHSITQEEFIAKAREVHGDQYDYSKVKYTRSHDKIIIICPKHGEFEQVAKEHLKYGCKKCANDLVGDRFRLTTEEFIRRAREVHGDKYDYSKVKYNGSDDNVCIICPEHGEFWQTPHTHLSTSIIHGCPFCANAQNVNEERLFNDLMKAFGDKYTIVKQKKFPWLKNKKRLSLDYYIQELNIGIEYQGLQHYTNVELFKNRYDYQHNNDLIKIKQCNEHNIKLLHFSYDKKVSKYEMEYVTYCDFNELKHIIEND